MAPTRGLICIVAVMAAGIVLAWPSPLQAAEGDARLEALERRLVEQERRIADQERKIGELKTQLDQGDLAPAQREQIEKIIKDIQADAPAIKVGDWAENLDLFGDLRLRWRYRKMGENHLGSRGAKALSRGEFRLRFGAKKTWWDKQMEVGFRLDSDAGLGGSRTGNDVPFGSGFAVSSDEPVLIGLAYAKYAPEAVKGLTVIAGKFENPLVTVKTEMLWDEDFCPEGIAAIYALQGMEKVQPFVAAGAVQLTPAGAARLSAYQGGIVLAVSDDLKITGTATWYDWHHVEGPIFLLGAAGGNTPPTAPHPGELGAQEFDVLNTSAQVETKLGELPLAAFVDYARNFEDDVSSDDEAYSIGVKVGKDKKEGDWFVRYRWAEIDENVFPSIVGDADFMGTDRKGHEVGAGYMISDFLKFETEVLYNVARSSEPAGTGRARQLQVLFDLNWSW